MIRSTRRPGGIVAFELRGAGLGAGGAQQVLVFVDAHRPAVAGGGATVPQWALGAQRTEGDRAFRGHRPGVPARAGDGAGRFVDAEVVEGEPAGHGRAQRLGFDHRVVPAGPVGRARRAGAVGGIAVHLEPPAARAGRRVGTLGGPATAATAAAAALTATTASTTAATPPARCASGTAAESGCTAS